MPKGNWIHVRVDDDMKQALQEYCKINYLKESSAVRMMIAQYPTIKEILKQNMREKEAAKCQNQSD